MTLADNTLIVHNIPARKTARAGFSSPEITKADSRVLRRFYVRSPLHAFYGRALAGIPSGMPGSFVSGLLTLPCARPPRLAAGRGFTTHIGAVTMAATPFNARPAQTFPLTLKAARRAARLWFTGAPTATLATWRDDAYRTHCGGLPVIPARTEAFNTAFAGELARIIAAAPAVPADNRDQYEAVVTDALMEPENVTVSHGHFQWVKEDGSMTEPLAGYAVVLKGVRHE